MTRAQAAGTAAKWLPIIFTIIAGLCAILAYTGKAGVAVGAAQTTQADLASQVADMKQEQKADHDELNRVQQRVDDLDKDVREALTHLPRH